MTGSQGPRSAACIGLLHLNQFPVSLHLGRDQGAEGVQVTSRTAEISPKQRELRTNLCICVLGLVTRARSLLHRKTPPRDPLLQDVSQGPAGRTINQAANLWSQPGVSVTGSESPGLLSVLRTCAHSAQSQTVAPVAPWPLLTYCTPDAPAGHREVYSIHPYFTTQAGTQCGDHELVPPAAHLLRFPPLSACAQAPGFLVRPKSPTSPSSCLNLRRRRPRSQGNTPKRRCRVTSARRRGRPGAPVRGKEEEFPRGKPRARSSPTWRDQKRPKAFPWQPPASGAAHPRGPGPWDRQGTGATPSLDCTVN